MDLHSRVRREGYSPATKSNTHGGAAGAWPPCGLSALEQPSWYAGAADLLTDEEPRVVGTVFAKRTRRFGIEEEQALWCAFEQYGQR